jgi:hypothetical protein
VLDSSLASDNPHSSVGSLSSIARYVVFKLTSPTNSSWSARNVGLTVPACPITLVRLARAWLGVSA